MHHAQLTLSTEMKKKGSNQIIRIKMKPYLKDYLVHLYGSEPIRFNDRSKYNELIMQLISKAPDDYIPSRETEGIVQIQLPYNNKKDVRSYYYLSMNSQEIIQQRIYAMFYAEVFHFVNKCAMNKNKGYATLSIKNAIILFLEQHGINPDSVTYETVRKQYYRYRKSLKVLDPKNILSL